MAVKTPKVPAPIGGWNTRDPLSVMEPTDAVSMTNLIPDIDGVAVRPGFTLTHTLLSTSHWVNSIFSWQTQYGERLYAATAASAGNHGLYDISTSTVSALKTGYVNSKWQSATMGGVLALVNGGDQPQRIRYTPGNTTVDDLPIGGNNPEKFRRIHVFKSRSYFSTGEEPAFWYSAVNALGGSLTRFPIDRVARSSGNVIDINSLTRDGGSGPDDFFVIFLDSGEVLIYQGSNPGDASDWALVGRYKLGRVLTSTQFGGKLHVVTEDDYNILPDDLITQGVRVPTKLSGAARDAVAREASDNYQIFFDSRWGWRIINVPYASKREQHITNLRTGGACRFDISANCWARYNGELYFGGASGRVYRIRSGDDNGSAITFACQQAYTDFQDPFNKTVLNYRNVWSSEGTLTYASGLGFDYDKNTMIQTQTETESGPVWDTSPWDTTSWSTNVGAKLSWADGVGEGQSISMFVRGTTTKRSVWHHTDYRLDISRDSL